MVFPALVKSGTGLAWFPTLQGPGRFSKLNRVIAVSLIAVALAIPPGPASADDAPSKPAADPEARAVVQKLMDAMGGSEAFQNTGALRFTFAYTSKDTLRTARTHWWDRRTGQYRIQGVRKGEPFVFLFNTGTKDGRVFLNGKEQLGAEGAPLLERAYALFINDTYWFLMPAKLFDPGVHLQMDGEAVVNGSPADRVKVTFDNVGLTPGDTYWAYIDRTSHLMTRWGMILQDERDKPDARETLYDWTEWTRHGAVTLASGRVKVDDPDKTLIEIRDIQVADSFPAEIFSNPLPVDIDQAH
jgi:hypothetical protein